MGTTAIPAEKSSSPYIFDRSGNSERNSVFRYFGTTGVTFNHGNTENNIGIGTDVEWMIPNDFFGIFFLILAPTKNLHNVQDHSDEGTHLFP